MAASPNNFGLAAPSLSEQPLGLVGEPALEEVSDEIIVFRDILAEVVARWDHHKE